MLFTFWDGSKLAEFSTFWFGRVPPACLAVKSDRRIDARFYRGKGPELIPGILLSRGTCLLIHPPCDARTWSKIKNNNDFPECTCSRIDHLIFLGDRPPSSRLTATTTPTSTLPPSSMFPRIVLIRQLSKVALQSSPAAPTCSKYL